MIIFSKFTYIFNIWFFLFGIVIGSFLNVVIFRMPRGFSLVRPGRSFCRNCKHKLHWYENIPILSYIFLRARCSQCNSQISLRYPIVEFLSGLLFLAITNTFGFSSLSMLYCFFAALLLAITFIDIDFRIIPDQLSFLGIGVGLLLHFLLPQLDWKSSIYGLGLGGGLFWIMAKTYEKITHREGLGMGDVKLLAMIGVYLGPQGVVGTIILSSFLGSIVGLLMIMLQRGSLKTAIPYGPFLAIGALSFLFWGDTILLML